MSFFDDIGGWFGDVGDWFGNNLSYDTSGGAYDLGGLVSAGQIYDSPIGPVLPDFEFPTLDDPGTNFDESGGLDIYNPNATGTLADGLLGNDVGGNTGFGGVQSSGGGGGGAQAGGTSAKTSSPLYKQAASIVGSTAANLLRNGALSGNTDPARTVSNATAGLPKLNPMSPSGAAAAGRGNGPAATANASDAISAWTKLFSGAH